MQLVTKAEYQSPDTHSLVKKVIQVFENLEYSNLEALRSIYTEDVCFEDPAHGIQGLETLISYFESLYKNLDSCHFKFHKQMTSDDGIFLSWTMFIEHKKIKQGEVIRVEGASYLKTHGDKVFYHRDYFDLGTMVYENIPLLGNLIRYIKNRLGQ